MDKKQLLETANQLKKVSEKTATEYNQKAEQITSKMNVLMQERKDLENLIGENNFEMMKDNNANHVRFIASILKNYNPTVLTDTILWVFRAYRSHGFMTNYWAAQLNSWIALLKKTLTPESYDEIYPYYEWILLNIPSFVTLSDEKLDASNTLH